jgi:HEAT repeat protein
MKLTKIIYGAFFFLLFMPSVLEAQDKRTTKTKVADVLALLPATDNPQAERLYHELVGLGEDGMTLVTDQVLPNGNEEGIAARFAVSLLTHYATTKDDKEKIEQVYLTALKKAENVEVKAYFIDNLKLIGSNASVKPLTGYLGESGSFDQSVSALEIIGTTEARQALLDALSKSTPAIQEKIIKALGELKFQPAVEAITGFVASENAQLKKKSLWALALIADVRSKDVLVKEAKAVDFRNDPTEATSALVEFIKQIITRGSNVALVTELCNMILMNTTYVAQQHFRLAGLEGLSQVTPGDATKILIKERTRFDGEYRKEVLKVATPIANTPAVIKLWKKEYKKSSGEEQADILAMLVRANPNASFIEAELIPELYSSNLEVRKVAAQGIANSRDRKYVGTLVDYLIRSDDDAGIQSAKIGVLQLINKDDCELIAAKIETAGTKNKVAMLQILAERRAVRYFNVVAKLTASSDGVVSDAAFIALPNVSSPGNTADLLKMLTTTNSDDHIKALQAALIASVDEKSAPLVNLSYESDKTKLIPVLPYVQDAAALNKVSAGFYSASEKEGEVAFEALLNWQNQDAVRTLISIRKNDELKKYHEKAFPAAVGQVMKSTLPDDQKLLLLKELMTLATTKQEKTSIVRSAGNVRTFLSLVFVSAYLDDADLAATASRSSMQLSLPTADAKPGMTGVEVRTALGRILSKLTGEDSQYERIDIETYLTKMPYTRGYESIFNGRDLSGWQGLVENPIARSKMSQEILAKKQAEANAKVSQNWSVKDGMIFFQGDGANLVTTRPYGDFEMIVDWKISKNGDSGIYLRGSPQVQIWDISRVDAGAQVGSGGLYNNKTGQSAPLVVADNPIGEWNTFRIKMVGDRVTVYLNGILVVDNVVMENYWDRGVPIFPEEAIELQAHGTELAFRNLYVNELSSKPYQLSSEEKKDGFELLFNGKDLNNWIGNKNTYVVEDNTIAIYPAKEAHGNLATEKEFSDFVFRFEFQLTPGANNGLGIHTPLEGDAAYIGKEIQILDNDAPAYSKLEVWQYHGSVYGVIPGKRGFLKPTGEWNYEEVSVKGDKIKVTLNGIVITEGDFKEASKNGTLDHKEHPGLQVHKGHIAFLGHGSVVKFRNIRIKEITGAPAKR